MKHVLRLNAWWDAFRRTGVHPLVLSLVVSVGLVLFYNNGMWQKIFHVWPERGFGDVAFLLSIAFFLTSVLFLLIQIFALPKIVKPMLIGIVLVAAGAAWFISGYGVMVDQNMIANVIETDPGEAGDLMSFGFIVHMIVYGLLPAALIWLTPMRRFPIRQEITWRGSAALSSFLVIGIIAALFFQDYASLIRNNRYLRNMINPSAPIYYTVRYFQDLYAGPSEFQIVAKRVERTLSPNAQRKPVLMVVVVGETARAANFSLDGYARDTNPELSKLSIVNFTNATSCGTSTAESLPCMFSVQARSNYDKVEAQNSENVLDILKRAGVDVVWIENQSGCKGVCTRVETMKAADSDDPGVCKDGECLDEALVSSLRKRTENLTRDTVIVLHQMGSHGPAYFKRYAKDVAAFAPTCNTTQLQSCSLEEIRNSYDNSIRYTDKVLADIVSVLKDREKIADTAMIYASDHGESLGEMGLYLHGMPYAFSPEYQRHIPMMMWMSPEFTQRHAINNGCLALLQSRPVSHDFFFHSILGAADVGADVYDRKLDLFAACKGAGPTLALDHTVQQDHGVMQ